MGAEGTRGDFEKINGLVQEDVRRSGHRRQATNQAARTGGSRASMNRRQFIEERNHTRDESCSTRELPAGVNFQFHDCRTGTSIAA